jgi:hypothetical protein
VERRFPTQSVRSSDALQLRVLESLQSARRYSHWIAALAAPHLGDDPIEIGSGLGDHVHLWLELGVPRITASDFDPTLVDALRARFNSDDRVEVHTVDLTAPPAADHSAAVALNVLEHIDDDVGALRRVQELVRPEGAIGLFVPAFQFAMSRFDREIGHFRRYTKTTLIRAMTRAGIRVERVHYVNAPGLLAWVVGMRVLGLEPRDGSVLRTWDRLVIPATRRVETLRPPPFGQSLFAVGRVPAR